MIRAIKTWTRLLLLTICGLQGMPTAGAATYRVGDVVTNFTFVARRPFTRPDGTAVAAGATVELQDFAGHIVFLEWFAVWCPYCVAAAPQVEAGIVDHYASRGGNPHGVPVLHIAVNQEARSSYQAQTDSFITQHGFGITVNDYDNTSTNRVRFMFQSSGQPIFAVINGVTDSPTHRPWQLLVNHLGYGDTDFNLELANFRAAIDQVQAAPPRALLSHPRWTADGTFEITLQGQPNWNYRVEVSEDLNLTGWSTIATVAASTNRIVIRDTNAPPTQRYYRVVSP